MTTDTNTIKHNKLVRDKIPDRIKKEGDTCSLHYATDEEYKIKLKEKLVEEAIEYQESDDPEEIADILEVISAIIDNTEITIDELKSIKHEKATERGRFNDKIVLETTEQINADK